VCTEYHRVMINLKIKAEKNEKQLLQLTIYDYYYY